MTRKNRAARALPQQAPKFDRLTTALAFAQLRHRHTWFKLPAKPFLDMTARRVEFAGIDLTPVLKPVGWRGPVGVTEHWADTLLHCPSLSGNRHTVRFAGKPYHWRQDYTGQLKLAAGESPW